MFLWPVLIVKVGINEVSGYVISADWMRTGVRQIPGRMLKNGCFIRLLWICSGNIIFSKCWDIGNTSPDLNGDGVIEPYEYVKVCPCFDVKEFLRSGRELLFVSLVALVVPVLLSGCRSKKEVINRESEVRVDSSLNSSSGKSLVKNKVASEKDSEVVVEHIEQVLFVFPVDTLGLKVGMVDKTVVDRKNVNEKQLLQEVNSQSVSLSDMSAKTEIHKTGVEKTTNRTTGGWYWYGIILLVLVIVCWIYRLMKKAI